MRLQILGLRCFRSYKPFIPSGYPQVATEPISGGRDYVFCKVAVPLDKVEKIERTVLEDHKDNMVSKDEIIECDPNLFNSKSKLVYSRSFGTFSDINYRIVDKDHYTLDDGSDDPSKIYSSNYCIR